MSLGQKGQTNGCSYTVYCVHCVNASTESTGLTFLHQKTMYPPPYTTIPLRIVSTVSTVYCVHCVTASTKSIGLTFLHPRQCPHHHIPLFYCVLHTAYCVNCILWFDLFVSKTMSPPQYSTIPLHPLHTACTGLTFLHQRQCPHHHIALFYCVLHPLHTAPTVSTMYCVYCVTASTESTGLTFLHQRQYPHHHIPLSHCILGTASTGLTFLHQHLLHNASPTVWGWMFLH